MQTREKFKYYPSTLKRSISFCEYKNEILIKGNLIGEGLFGQVYELIADKPTIKYIVKKEIPVLDSLKNKFYPDGRELKKEARIAKIFLGDAAYCGKAKDELSPHYVLMPKVNGIKLQKYRITDLDCLYNLCSALIDAVGIFHHHIPAYVHGDIKLDNFLINTKDPIKVTFIDFGKTTQVGTPCGAYINTYPCYHIAPELNGPKEIPSATNQDIYALGFLFKLLFFNNVKLFEEESDKANGIQTLIKDMQHINPESRPTINTVQTRLYDIFFPKKTYSYFSFFTAPLATAQRLTNDLSYYLGFKIK